MNVRATVERLGRTHVGKSWWVDLAEALVAELEPVVAERDQWKHDTKEWANQAEQARIERNRYRTTLESIALAVHAESPARIARAALDRGTP